MSSLGEELPKEMARVRDEIMPQYMEIGKAGRFGLYMIRAELDYATKALAEGDIIAMMRAYQSLKAYTA